MRERVAFDAPFESPDGYGGIETGWTEQFTRPAEFIYQRGSEAVDTARLSGKAVYKIRIRNGGRAGEISTDWRMRDLRREVTGDTGDYVAGVYNIVEIDTITDRQWAYLVVESGVAV